jgi:uncharacterized protein (UPF0303 family)
MKRLRDVLIVVVLGTVVCGGAVYAIACISGAVKQADDHALSVNVVYGQALAACEKDEQICSFSSVESAQRYLDSAEHKASVATRELKEQQNAAANKATSAVIENAKHRRNANGISKRD